MIRVVSLGNAGLGQLDVRSTFEDKYATLREKCIEQPQLGPQFCNAILPRNMIYALTRPGEGYTLPWWAWMIAGYLAAKVLK